MSNNPPLLGGGAGTEISFSTLRDFYSDTNPVSLSEFTRGGSLVASTFSGASTVTTSTGSSTKNDFAITQTNATVYTGNPGSFATRESDGTTNANTGVSLTYTVNAGDSVISTTGGAFSDMGDDPSNPGSPNIQSVGGFFISINGGSPTTIGNTTLYWKGPAWQSGHKPSILSYYSSFSEGDVVTMTTTSGNHSGSVSLTSARVSPSTIYDTTFQNTSSVSTYTLTTTSTRIGSNSQVYAAQASRLVADDSTSNQWTIAYDNVTGSGSGNAGDIAVTVTSQADAGTETNTAGAQQTASATAPSLSGISFVSVVGIAQNPNDDGSGPSVTVKRNGTQVAFHRPGTGSSAFVTYTGTINSGDVFTAQGGDQSNVVTINYTTPSRSIVFQNNGSTSLTLGSNSTGGARTIAASASSTVQTGGSTNNADWQVHFDTSSGNCNVGIPAAISSGNPCNMDLFNTVTTPVG